jgi:hypothetical protein
VTFGDPHCDVVYVDWFISQNGSEEDCDASDITSVHVRFTRHRLKSTFHFAGMTDFGLAHIEAFDVSFDTRDANSAANFGYVWIRHALAYVQSRSEGPYRCLLHGHIDTHRKRVTVWAPTSCIRAANRGRTVTSVRIKADVNAERNECAPGQCIDSWYDDLNYPYWSGRTRWSSFVYRHR